MAMRSASLLLLCASVSISTLVAAQAGDEAALLAFKAAAVSGGAHDHDNLLPSWNTTSTGSFCTWEGVRCGARHRRVVALSLPPRGLTGTLSPAIGNLTFLRALDLSSNNWLHGEIPATIGRLVRLRMLDLSNNTFDGGLPANLSFCVSLLFFRLSSNRLHGCVPVELGNRLTSLQILSLANNSMTGEIPGPASLANMSSLSYLHLGINQFEGSIPPELGSTGGLRFLYLHENNLSGKKKRHFPSALTITLISISSLALSVSIVALVRLIHKKLRRRNGSQLIPPVVREQYGRVSYQALLNGTNGFSEANLIGQGSYGTVYKCILQDQGAIVAVKVFNTQISRTTRSFVAECETLRRVRHRCLMKIITCCSSINHHGQEFKALVFEFMPNGSLNNWLHPDSDTLVQTNTLSFEQRLHIAVDIMDALDYLHNHCQPSIIHCDLKPSNILLSEDMSARVGDFGISRILPESASITQQNSTSTSRIRGTIGYVAPEYGEGSPVLTQGDVYSLGILLLEMFTGKSPTNEIFGDSLDLHKFSENALPERIQEIVDPIVWMHTDAYNRSARNGIINYLVSVVALGISCSKKQPMGRIPIQDAAIEMHGIRDSYLKFARSLLVEHGGGVTSDSQFPQ